MLFRSDEWGGDLGVNEREVLDMLLQDLFGAAMQERAKFGYALSMER